MPALAAGVSSIGVIDGEHAVLHRDLDAEAVEPAAGVVLHVLEIIRIHELAVRIERREHAFHRRVNQVVITHFVAVDVILPDQLDRLGKNGNLRVTAIVVCLLGMRCIRAHAKKKTKSEQAD